MRYATDQKVTDSSAAKAYMRRQIREANTMADALIAKRMEEQHLNVKRNVKLAKQWFLEEVESYDEFLVHYLFYKNWGISQSKHFRAEYTTIEPELMEVRGIGSLCRLIAGYFDSKKFCKGQVGFYIKWASQFYFDEHFLYRYIQRKNQKSIGEMGEFLYPVLEWLIAENIPLSSLDTKNYFVFKDVTLVTHRLPDQFGIVFKTILNREQYNSGQKEQFSNAHQWLSGSDSAFAVLTDKRGQPLRLIPKTFRNGLLNTLNEDSFWLRPLLNAHDIRTDIKY